MIRLGAAGFPAPQGYVTDAAHVLDDGTKQQLVTMLRTLEHDTTAEVAVATVSSLDGLSVEDYAVQLFKQWGVGQRGVNNGVLVLVAPHERRIRIEVGYGLEPILPDGLAGEIIRKECLPKFRDADYANGILNGVTKIASIVRAHHVLTPEERRALTPNADGPWFVALFVMMFVMVGAFATGAGARAKVVGAILFGLTFTAVAFVLTWLITPGWTWLFAAIALLMAAMAFAAGRRPSIREMLRGRRTISDGWVMGGDSSGSSSDGSSGSSDSFGGGESGGGGASGSW